MAWPRKRSRPFDGPGSRVSSAPPSYMDGSSPSSVQRRSARSLECPSWSLDASLVETMYAHCIYCHAGLGNNSVIETFPVGRRLAFDAVKGRLWAVCRKCERWNLTPLEERWEAVEDCERRFRAARKRVSTENIGLARLDEGLELVRIGQPLRPEFAAWRYGDQFGRRRKRMMVKSTIAVAGMAALWGGAAVAGVAVGGFYGFSHNIYKRIAYGRADAIIARVHTGPARIDVK